MIKQIAKMRLSITHIESLSNKDLTTGPIKKELSSIEKLIIEINKSVLSSIEHKKKISDFSTKISNLQKEFIILITPISDDAFYELSTLDENNVSADFLGEKSSTLSYALE